MDKKQTELPMAYPVGQAEIPLLPARMVNEYEYCPRLAYLEWVQGEWAGNADTVEGSRYHRRVDSSTDKFPTSAELNDEARLHARSVSLSSVRLGLIAKLDLIETEDGCVIPVDYKRGKRPHVAQGPMRPSAHRGGAI